MQLRQVTGWLYSVFAIIDLADRRLGMGCEPQFEDCGLAWKREG